MTLVDGCGRPKLIDIPADPELPLLIQYAHEGIPSGPGSRVGFLRSEERDPDGRIVYRQRGVYKAPIRIGFLRLQAITTFNPPRLGE